MLATDGSDPVQVSPSGDSGRSHFPLYLSDGRLVYVTEHITPGQAWTDFWAVRPGGSEPRQALLEDVQVQGPFSLSGDAQWLLFSSPRGGNFDVYRVPLSPEGKEAMKVRSAETEPSPGLVAHVAQVAQGAPAGQASPVPTSASGGSPPSGGEETGPSAPPYLPALVGLVVVWLAIEATLRVRRARRRSAGAARGRER
jgi:hypothetical protein